MGIRGRLIMFETEVFNEINANIDLINLTTIAKKTALIGYEILKKNYNKQ